MGAAIADYHRHGIAGRLRVFATDFDEDEIPVETLFRAFDEMPPIEQRALQLSKGRILDVGAGAGCHSLALQDMGHSVTAIDISPLSVETMRERGVEEVREEDFWNIEEQFDTILMLMNGIGIVGNLDSLTRFFCHVSKLLAPNGQLLMDSSDISYVFEDEEGIIEMPEGNQYYGEMTYQMQYKRVKGEPFPWLYVDPETLILKAKECGFACEVIAQGEHYDYLARITRMG